MGVALTVFYVVAAGVAVFLAGQAVYYTRSAGRLVSRDQYVADRELHRVLGLDGKYPSRREVAELRRQCEEQMAAIRMRMGTE